MKMCPILLLTLLLFTGCVTAQMPEGAQEPPQDANVVVLLSNEAPDAMYDAVYQALARDGYSFQQSDEARGTMRTAPKDIGDETMAYIEVFVDEHDQGSETRARAYWDVSGKMAAGLSAASGIDATGASAARWGERGRGSLAFAAMVEVLQDVPHGEMDYIVD